LGDSRKRLVFKTVISITKIISIKSSRGTTKLFGKGKRSDKHHSKNVRRIRENCFHSPRENSSSCHAGRSLVPRRGLSSGEGHNSKSLKDSVGGSLKGEGENPVVGEGRILGKDVKNPIGVF